MNYNNGNDNNTNENTASNNNTFQQIQARLTDRATVGYCGFDLLAILALVLMVLTFILFISVIVMTLQSKNKKSLTSSFYLIPPYNDNKNKKFNKKLHTSDIDDDKHTTVLAKSNRKIGTDGSDDEDKIEKFDDTIDRSVEIITPKSNSERLSVPEKKNLNAVRV